MTSKRITKNKYLCSIDMKMAITYSSILSSALLLTLWLPATTALASSDFWLQGRQFHVYPLPPPTNWYRRICHARHKWTFKVKPTPPELASGYGREQRHKDGNQSECRQTDLRRRSSLSGSGRFPLHQPSANLQGKITIGSLTSVCIGGGA